MISFYSAQKSIIFSNISNIEQLLCHLFMDFPCFGYSLVKKWKISPSRTYIASQYKEKERGKIKTRQQLGKQNERKPYAIKRRPGFGPALREHFHIGFLPIIILLTFFFLYLHSSSLYSHCSPYSHSTNNIIQRNTKHPFHKKLKNVLFLEIKEIINELQRVVTLEYILNLICGFLNEQIRSLILTLGFREVRYIYSLTLEMSIICIILSNNEPFSLSRWTWLKHYQ